MEREAAALFAAVAAELRGWTLETTPLLLLVEALRTGVVLADLYGTRDLFAWLLALSAALHVAAGGDDPVLLRWALAAGCKALAVVGGDAAADASVARMLDEGLKHGSAAVQAAALQGLLYVADISERAAEESSPWPNLTF